LHAFYLIIPYTFKLLPTFDVLIFIKKVVNKLDDFIKLLEKIMEKLMLYKLI
jgi:hypothetical protein